MIQGRLPNGPGATRTARHDLTAGSINAAAATRR